MRKGLPAIAAIVLAMLSAAAAMAQTPATPAPGANAGPPSTAARPRGDFASHKASALAKIDERTAALSTARTCVAAAQAPADLKACHEKAKDMRHGRHSP